MSIKTLAILIFSILLSLSQSWAQTPEDSTRIQFQELKDRLDGISENMATLNSDVSILKWVKISGYIQARYEYNDSSKYGVAGGYDVSKNLNANNFYIRRGRIKFTVQPGSFSKYVIYFDASKNTVSLKEAYVELYKTIQAYNFTLTFGQFNWPFGYEIEYSSSKRDFPERSLAENNLFKGERDRGVNLTWAFPKYLQFNAGLFQGYGIEDKNFTWFDPTKAKDVIARAKAKLGMVDVGVSGYWGKAYIPGSAAVPGVTTWYDKNGNGVIDPDEIKTTAPKAAVPAVEKDKRRYGADAQVYLDVLPIGGTGIRGELYLAKDYNKTANDSLADEMGWYLWLSQNIYTKFGAAARYDYWDPNTDSNAKNDATGTLSLAFHYFWDSYVRITTAYDIPHQLKESSIFSKYSGDKKDNRFTLQFQFMF
ncbi:MAG: OprO/OprP family phosphate-selective porin [candidate division Zixibacteria bacterium]|nr:OprO/OprP family phosphate-selective porin [candidate division Zixibacteria bacterium]